MNDNWLYFNYDKSGTKYKPKTSIDLLVGCPVQKRDWIISEWFSHMMVSCGNAKLKPGFIFVMDPTEEPLFTMINNLCKINSVDLWVGCVKEEEREDSHDWDEFRYMKMVELRNLLLEGVREIAPPLFLSCDSDMLLHDQTVFSLAANIKKEWSAIGGRSYLTHIGTAHPTYANINIYGNLIRPDQEGVFQTEILMAIVMMKPEAYNVDYVYDNRGEDIGHGLKLKEKGLKVGYDGTFINKHCMRKGHLTSVDQRVGF